ncbi:unnamed protein product [Ostreobium quekettii]|uniref:Guanine nucleotide-binding protein subunit beta-like protein n=1 Tax=Ostreobium quekettii TaxID=121088 RepID=A0A8S1J8U4_9CHLO|nr:unnamed protein product [Ostreobium quekettii]
MDTNTSVDLLQHSNSIMALHMAQVGKQDELLLSSGYDGLLCVWDVRTLRGTRPHLFGRFKTDGAAHINRSGLGPPRCEILCLEYDRVKRVIFTGGNDCTVKVWSFNTYDLLGRHSGHHEPVTCLALDGNFLFSGSEDTSVRIWDAVPAPPHGTSYAACPFSGGTHLKSLCCHTGTVTGLAVSQLSGHLLSCASDGLVLFWDYVAGKVVRKIEHRDELSCMALRPDVSEVLVGTRSNNVLRFPAGEAVRVKGKTGREGHAR